MEEGLMKRFRDLEASQAKLREQLGVVSKEGSLESEEGYDDEDCRNCYGRRRGREFDVVIMPGYFTRSPYRSVLQHIGHAVSVCRPDTGVIVFWNRSAENLYGWKECEALGQNVTSLLINEGSHRLFEEIMEGLKSGKTWSGLFPFKKRSKEMFMAMVTHSPLYENGELIGAITVSSDSATLNDINNKSKLKGKEAQEKSRKSKTNFTRANMPPQQQIVSTVSNLASKIFSRNHTISNHGVEISQECCGCILEEENMRSENARISAAKVMSKFNIQGSTSSQFQESDKDAASAPVNNVANGHMEEHQFLGVEQFGKDDAKQESVDFIEASLEANGCLLAGRKLAMNCDIHWEDLLLGEQIGQGSYAVVYRGAWNGSVQ